MTDRTASRRFRGSVVTSEAVVGVFFDALELHPDHIHLRPVLRRDLVVRRDEVEAVEFERQWLPPFWVRSVVRFRFTDGTYAQKVMIPGRTRALRKALTDADWPVTQVRFASTEHRQVRSMRDHVDRERRS